MSRFEEMAMQRNFEANMLTDEEIHLHMMEKILTLPYISIQEKANMLLDSVVGNRFIFEGLKTLEKRRIISSFEFVEVLKAMSIRVMAS